MKREFQHTYRESNRDYPIHSPTLFSTELQRQSLLMWCKAWRFLPGTLASPLRVPQISPNHGSQNFS